MADFPNNPSPGQIARADQRFAIVRAVVDKLAETTLPATGDRTADVLQLAHGPVIDAMIELADPGDEQPALIAMAGELLYRVIAEADR